MRIERYKTALQYIIGWSVTSAFLLLITHTNKARKEEEKIQDSLEHTTWSPDCEPSRMRQRLPVGLVIGAQNTGSNAIFERLQIDPRFKVAMNTHFFDTKKKYDGGNRVYRSLMPVSCKTDIPLEATSSYLEAEDVLNRVRQYNQSVRLLVVLRDPIDRAFEDFKQANGGEEADFEELAVDANGTVNADLEHISRSNHEVRLKQWLEAFPRSQWHFVDASAFLVDPATELNAIATFFGLQPRFKNSLVSMSVDCSKEDCELREGNALTTSVKKALSNIYEPHVKTLSDLIQLELTWMPKYLH